MSVITRRESIKKAGRFLVGAATCAIYPSFLSGCSDKELDQSIVAHISKKTSYADIGKLKLTVLYDNIPYKKGLRTDWGFSCLVEGIDKPILFDAGRYDDLFLSNLSKLQIDSHQIDNLFISHDHPDHIGGVLKFLEIRPEINLALVKSFRAGFKKAVRKLGADITEIDRPSPVTNNCFSVGEMKSFVKNEHALVILTDKGSIIITGCAHTGIVEIVERTKKITNDEVLLVMGGFHLLMDGGSSIRKKATRLKELGVQYVAPTHCSGEEAQQIFARLYSDRYLDSGLGRIITANDFT